MGSAQVPVSCFLSYARADDDEYGFVSALKKSLEHLCFSDGGRRLEVFVDRESVGWGDDWRSRIADGVANAMVFLPVISLQYFDREACRAELLAFHAAARGLGVPQLLLPLIVFGHGRITSAHADPLVRTVERLQHVDIHDAVMAGPGSRDWRTTMRDVARRLVAAVDHAEDAVSEPDTELGLHELAQRIEDRAAALAGLADEVTACLVEFTRHVNAARRHPGTARAVAAELAGHVDAPARDVLRLGGAMETAMSDIDADLRRYHALVLRFGTAAMKDAVRRDAAGFEDRFGGLRETMAIMAHFVAKVRPLELLSAPLRKSIRPLRTGVGAIHVAMATMESWARLGSELVVEPHPVGAVLVDDQAAAAGYAG